jgi:hypothetical protein
MVYPQYWLVPDTRDNFAKHMETIKSHYCKQKKTNVPKKSMKGKGKARRGVEENDDIEEGATPDFIDLTQKTSKTKDRAAKTKIAKTKEKSTKTKEKIAIVQMKTTGTTGDQEIGTVKVVSAVPIEAETLVSVQVPVAR